MDYNDPQAVVTPGRWANGSDYQPSFSQPPSGYTTPSDPNVQTATGMSHQPLPAQHISSSHPYSKHSQFNPRTSEQQSHRYGQSHDPTSLDGHGSLPVYGRGPPPVHNHNYGVTQSERGVPQLHNSVGSGTNTQRNPQKILQLDAQDGRMMSHDQNYGSPTLHGQTAQLLPHGQGTVPIHIPPPSFGHGLPPPPPLPPFHGHARPPPPRPPPPRPPPNTLGSWPRYGRGPLHNQPFQDNGPLPVHGSKDPGYGHLAPRQPTMRPPNRDISPRPYSLRGPSDMHSQDRSSQWSQEKQHQQTSQSSSAHHGYADYTHSAKYKSNVEFTPPATYHTLEESVVKAKDKVKLSKDQQWVNSWLEDKNKNVDRKKEKGKTGSTIAIPDARRLLREALSITEDLQQAETNLRTIVNSENDTWDKLCTDITLLKTRLAEIRALMSNTVIEELSSKVSQIKKKRQRLRLKRRRSYKQQQKQLKQREERHQQVDAWQARILQKDEDKKREKELKAAADATLGEVRRKLANAEKARDLLKGLAKLRQLRKEAAERKGVRFTRELDTDFEERSDELLIILRKQLIVYEAEKKTLEAMLEMEAEENREKELEERKCKIEDLERRKERTIRRLLFGRDVPLEDDDPMQAFRQYYAQADLSLEAFIQIRCEWDLFLVPPSTGGSRLPDGWVKPPEPSSEIWASVLKERQTHQVTAAN